MSVIELLWHLNVTDTTKYLIFFGIIMCILMMCMMNGKKKNINIKKKKKKNSKYDYESEELYFNGSIPTRCQTNFMKCVNDNQQNGTNEFCYPCLDNGNAPDFFYNPQINEWVKLN